MHSLYSSCTGVPFWYPYLLPIGAGICGLICLFFYLFYVTGLAANNFQTWSAMDIIFTTLCFVILLGVSILTLMNCTDPNPLEYLFTVRYTGV